MRLAVLLLANNHFSSSHQIILLSNKDKHQGIYTYDIDSGKTELLYESKNELINSFELLE